MPAHTPTHPSAAIRASASVLLVRDGTAGLEVFLLQRHAGSTVLGGSFVFPGGKVDAADAAPDCLTRLDLAPQTLRERLHEPALDVADAAALHVAAIRETFEESGVLFAQGAPDAVAAACAAGPAEPFGARLAHLGLRLDTAALRPFSRWITPEHSVNLRGQRFDTRFFVAALPAGQRARHDDYEAVHSLWLTPRAALQQHWDGAMALMPPQIMSLAQLARAADVATLTAQIAARPPHRVSPQVEQIGDETVMAYPGDPLHPEGARVMPGPLRLWVRGKRFEPDGGFGGFFVDPA